jgi:SAM-dependent methyltransferase
MVSGWQPLNLRRYLAVMTRPRYDGLADWYGREIGGLEVTTTALDTLGRLVGAGPGNCLDLGCGTGITIPGLLERGWRVVGSTSRVISSEWPDNEPVGPALTWSRPMPPPCHSPTNPSTRLSRC